MHSITAANQQFPSASILTLFPADPAGTGTGRPGEPAQRLRVVDGIISITRNSWAEPFDTFGNFAA